MSFTTTKPAVGDPTKQSFASAVIDNDTELRDRSVTDLLRSFGDMEDWTNGATSAPDQWTLSGAGATIARDGTNFKIGTYSAAVTRVGTDCQLQLDAGPWIGGTGYYRSRVFTLGAWVRATVASRARIAIDDGVATQSSSYHTGGSTWEWLTVSITANSAATQILIELHLLTGNTTAQYDGVTLVEGTTCPPASSIRGVGVSGGIVGAMIADDAVTLAKLAHGTANKGIGFNGSGIPAEITVSAVVIATGGYTGDSTANRAIAHGLGVTPKYVTWVESGGQYVKMTNQDPGRIHYDRSGSKHVVTAEDATNFYVGNATNYTQSANLTATTYRWVAIG